MKLSKLLRSVAAVVSAVAMCAFSAGCSVEFGTNPNAKNKEIVAKPTAGENTKGMEITYGDFNKQYTYLLKSYEIEDDTDANIADACTQQRELIIDNLITNKILLRKAEEMGLSELTAEELEEVKKTTDEQIEQQIEYFSEEADYSDLAAEEVTDEIRHQRGGEAFDKFLEECGMTRDDLLKWTKEYFISTKVLDEVVKSITRADAEAKVQEFFGKIEEMYKTDPAAYEMQGYTDLWVPEGSRLIKHVLLGFDDALQVQIATYRNNSDDEGADKIRAAGAKELEEKVAEVQQKLDEMDEGKITFNEILLDYSADSAGSSMYPDGYVVIPNGAMYVKEFQEAAFVPEKIGDRTVCVTDYGVHIMIYAGDAKASQETIDDFTEAAFGEMKNEEFQYQLKLWKAEYNYEIDREMLRLDTKSETSDDSDNSDISNTSDNSNENGTSATE